MPAFALRGISYLLVLVLSLLDLGLNEINRYAATDMFSTVYEGDFCSAVPYGDYLESGAQPEEGTVYAASDYGASTDADAAANARAFNAAIEACARGGGGTVLVGGGRFTTGSVRLQSGVTLMIAGDSALVASRSAGDMNLGCVIYANGCENIGIKGPGKVCGEGNYYSRKPYKKPALSPLRFSDSIEQRAAYISRVRFPMPDKYGGIATLVNCMNVSVGNIVFENSAHWTLKLENCDGVTVSRLVIDNNRHIANTDGIDVLYSRDVAIDKTFISTADDGIVLKNWSADKVVEHVRVSGCEVMSCTNAFKIGTETRGDIRNVLVEDCRFFMRDIYPGTAAGIAIESTDGSRVSDVTVRNITMDRVICPLFIRLGNRNRYGGESADFAGSIEGITVENITASNIERCAILTGVRNSEKGTLYVRGVTLRGFTLRYTAASAPTPLTLPVTPEYETEYPDSSRFYNLPAYGVWARHIDGLVIEGFAVEPPQGSRLQKFFFSDVKNLTAEQ